VCRKAAEIGYAAVEFWGRGPDLPEQVATAHRHGLVVASMCGHAGLDDGLNTPASHPRILQELRDSITLAAKLGIPNLICFSGTRHPEQSSEAAIDACASCLRVVAPLAEQAGINVNLELLNSKINHPGYQCDHTAWGVAVCQRVNSPRIKLLYDIYHMQIMEGDIIRTIRDNIRWIGHFHTAGNPERQDLDDCQELHYPGIVRAIAATGYDGYVAHEFFPKGDPIEGLRRAFDLCDV
jgi:hydroxypyruvate isomerase